MSSALRLLAVHVGCRGPVTVFCTVIRRHDTNLLAREHTIYPTCCSAVAWPEPCSIHSRVQPGARFAVFVYDLGAMFGLWLLQSAHDTITCTIFRVWHDCYDFDNASFQGYGARTTVLLV